MVGAFRPDAHALQRQADLPADVLPLISRGNIHISGVVIGDAGGLAVLIPAEQVKLHLRAEGERQPRRLCILHSLFQQAPGIRLDDLTAGTADCAEHPHHAAMLRPPRKHAEGTGIGMQQQIGVNLAAEAGDGGAVNGDAIAERPIQFRGHDGNVLLAAFHIAEGHSDELHVLLRRILFDFFHRIPHYAPAFPKFVNWRHTSAGKDSCCPASPQ